MDNRNVSGKKEIIASLIWKMLERFGAQGITFLVQIVLARMLDPEVFGTISLLTVFIAVANVFIQNGFNTALIQKKEVDDVDYSSVFYASMAFAGALYAVLFVTAPVISDFYKVPELTKLLRVMAITLFFGALNSIQMAVIARKMEFHKSFICGLGATISSGIIGISMAYAGAGCWALIGQQLSNVIANCCIMWVVVKWRPKLLFSAQRLKVLLGYGWKLLLSGLINTLYTQLGNLIIGKRYDTEALAYYNKGHQFPSLLSTNLDSAIQSVMLPAYSQHQDDPQTVRAMMRRSIRLSTYLIFPALFGLSAVAEPLVILLLTEKWLPAVPYMQIFCISLAFYPVHSTNLQAINAMGHSEIFLKLEIIKKLYGTVILLISVQFGPMGMAISGIIGNLIGTVVNASPNKKLLGYSFIEQWRDMVPALLLSAVMMVIVRLVGTIQMAALPLLLLEIVVGVGVYVLGSIVFRMESFFYVIRQIRRK